MRQLWTAIPEDVQPAVIAGLVALAVAGVGVIAQLVIAGKQRAHQVAETARERAHRETLTLLEHKKGREIQLRNERRDVYARFARTSLLAHDALTSWDWHQGTQRQQPEASKRAQEVATVAARELETVCHELTLVAPPHIGRLVPDFAQTLLAAMVEAERGEAEGSSDLSRKTGVLIDTMRADLGYDDLDNEAPPAPEPEKAPK